MEPKFFIYGLVDPHDGQLRYVGKSARGMRRPQEHIQSAALLKDGTYKGNWLRRLQAEGLKPDIEVLEIHETAETLSEAERYFIAYFRFIGCRLTNLTDGGEGFGGCHTAATRAKMSRSRSGRAKSRQWLEASIGQQWARNRRPIVDENGDVYLDSVQAARILGLTSRQIRQGIQRGHLVHGHMFHFADEIIQDLLMVA